MKTRILLLLCIVFCNLSTAQKLIKDFLITTSSGDSLATDIYLPEKVGAYPVILMRTPYNKSQRNYGEIFNKNGFVFIVQDVRGRVKSSGKFKAWIDEELDGLETVDWIVKQPWSNGEVGLIGSSYSGYAAMQLASTNHPAIKAIVNNSGPIDLYDVIFPGGVFHNTALLPWTIAFTHHNWFNFPPYESGLSMNQLARQKPLNDALIKNNYKGVFWNYLVNHQTKDSYWRTVNVSDVNKIDIPTLHITGWFDFIATSNIDGYFDIINGQHKRLGKSNQKLIIGPWIHDDMMNGRTRVGEIDYGIEVKVGLQNFLKMSITYFNQYLKDANAKDHIPKVKFFEIGSNRWYEMNQLPKTKELVYYLHSEDQSLQTKANANGKQSFQHNPYKPVETLGGANIHFPFFGDTNGIRNQNDHEKNANILVYTSEPLTKDVHVFGKIKAKLFVSTTAKDADFTIKINQIDKEGNITNLRDGIQRLSLSKSLSYRNFIEPNSVIPIEIDLGYISALLAKGSKISIHISGSNYPKYSLNPGTKENPMTSGEFKTFKQTICTNNSYKSTITIPIRN